MLSDKSIGVLLTGGLGNQLFQLAVGLSLAENRELMIFEKPGRPRLNANGDPELFNLSVNRIASIVRRQENGVLLGRAFGYVLRSRIAPKSYERPLIVRLLVNSAMSLLNSIYARKLLYPVAIPDVGYSEISVKRNLGSILSPVLVGYFQSFVWPDSIKHNLQTLCLINEGPDFVALKQQANLVSPVIVHIRRGDYRTESTFGLLGKDYYQRAIEIVDGSYADHPIWVFSDDVSEAKDILSWLPAERVKFIPHVDEVSAASLMAMRFGCAYVIANSTFSWWGAYLSQSEDPLVIAPSPWFIGQKEPFMLIPPNWIRLSF